MVRKIELPDYVRDDIPRQVREALAEDIGSGDITAELIDAHSIASATLITRESAVMCGLDWAKEVFRQLGDVEIRWQVEDGDHLVANQTLCTLSGNARQILTGERTALNFMQTLMATATQTRTYVDAVDGKQIRILDTRKTLPGLRYAQKYAVLCGGGENHRLALYDQFLIKENHIAACGSIEGAIARARALYPDRKITLEVETLEELDQAVAAAPEQVMLDNFSDEMLATAVSRVPPEINIELSGNYDLTRLATTVATTRPIWISSGALTKNIHAIDLSLRLQ